MQAGFAYNISITETASLMAPMNMLKQALEIPEKTSIKDLALLSSSPTTTANDGTITHTNNLGNI